MKEYVKNLYIVKFKPHSEWLYILAEDDDGELFCTSSGEGLGITDEQINLGNAIKVSEVGK